MSKTLPVTVISGYLGSGKTTLVNHLLRNAGGSRLAVLVNDFGELAIDADLIEAEDDDIISISGGCVCCSFGSDLTAALMDLAKISPRPDHIVIEASGVAIPGSIVAAIGLLDGFSSDGVVVLADAETIERNAQDIYMGDTVTRQLDDADIILLNKTDLVDSGALKAAKQWINRQNPQARVVETVQGKVPPEIVLESFLGRKHATIPHFETVNLDILTLMPTGPIDVEALAEALAGDGCGIVRAKGFATSMDGNKILVQVVGHRWQTSLARGDLDDGIVCLGFKGVLDRDELNKLVKK